MKIGILGGGQLARMLAQSAKTLGIEIICIDPDSTCSAKFVTAVQNCAFTDIEAIHRIFADVDYVTYETENLPIESIEQLSNKFKIFPSIEVLKNTQDRLYEKQLFTSLAIPTPDYLPINNWDDLNIAVNKLGYPCVLKTRRNGYDGKGQAVIRNIQDAEMCRNTMPATELILEKFVPYDFEVSLISVRSKNGDTKFYPLTYNEHKNGILRISQAPYHDTDLENLAHQYATRILEKYNYVGVMAFEFFCVNKGLVANEIAPRVHNSGHWTIEGSETSQFENHLRAIAGLPLGPTNARGCCAMINCIGKEPENLSELLKIEGLYFHSYNKAARENRKLGHITICAKETNILTSLIKQICESC